MLVPLSQSTAAEGPAAAATAKLVSFTPGFVLTATAMNATLAERREQINNLLSASNAQNVEAVAEDLRDIILTIHVPKQVEEEIEKAFADVEKPALLRLSPIGEIANPLEPTIVLGVQDKKSVLDALRMLYAEMFTASNIAAGSEDRSAAVIIQPMPTLAQAFRVFRAGQYTIIEGSYGYGAWVGHGEPERFLFDTESLVRTEQGEFKGLFWDKRLQEKPRRAVTEDDARGARAYALSLGSEAPLLIGRTETGSWFCLGCLTGVIK